MCRWGAPPFRAVTSVVDERHVAADRVREIARHGVAVFEAKLYAAVAHLSDIGRSRIAVAHVAGATTPISMSLAVADEAVERAGQLVVPEAEVDTHAPLFGVFPSGRCRG